MKIKYSILSGLIFAVIMFTYLAYTVKIDIAIIVSVFILVLSPILFYFKIFSKIDFSIKFQDIDKQLVIYHGMTNHFKDGIAVGGTLYLMSDRLIFQTNLINYIKRHEQIILLNQIEAVEFVKTMGLVSNGILIKNKNSQEEQFVVNKREVWKEHIEKYLVSDSRH
ncbi:hypothetical protein [Flavobacterium sp. FlaQc-50]|uniref:hypothetical protein n=1 Tax=unclassified Flavobacterium TaxID=196869 RepID=UPI0037570AC2